VLPGAGEMADQELRYQVDGIGDDGREDDDEDGIPAPFAADAHATPERFESDAGHDVREERNGGRQGHDDDIAVPKVTDLVGEDRTDLVLIEGLQESVRHDEFR